MTNISKKNHEFIQSDRLVKSAKQLKKITEIYKTFPNRQFERHCIRQE